LAEHPAGTFLWLSLFDAIHHRGQLTACLRPMGGKVPAIYGPSADAQGSGAWQQGGGGFGTLPFSDTMSYDIKSQ
jgi:DinB family